MFSFSKEKCHRFMLAACLLLSAACSLSVAAAEEESAAEKIKRYEEYQKLFRKELNSQRLLIPDLRSQYDYIGGRRPSERSYGYFYDKKDRRRAEKSSKKRVEEWEENNSVYTICWSFSPFEGTGAELKAGKNNITYCIITADFVDIKRLKTAGKTETNLITFPQEFFPISLLAQRTALKKQFGSDVEENEVRTYYYSSDYQDRSNLPHIYILAIKPCSKPKLTRFYQENIFKKMDQAAKQAAEDSDNQKKSEEANNSPESENSELEKNAASGTQQNLEIKMSMGRCFLIISANTIVLISDNYYNSYYYRNNNGDISINGEEWINTKKAFPLKNRIDIKNAKLELDIQGFTVPLISNTYPDFLVIKIGAIPDEARGKSYTIRITTEEE